MKFGKPLDYSMMLTAPLRESLHGQGYISYPNGNSLDAEFVAGKIMGHGVFRCRDDP